MPTAIPKNGALSGMILPALVAATVLPLSVLVPSFRAHFAAPLSPAFQAMFLISILAMALHKLESFWFEEFEHCPVYLSTGRADWSRNVRKAVFLSFVPTFLGMLLLAFFAFLGPPWHLVILTIWLGQGAHELHHAAKSLARRQPYPGIVTSLLFVGVMWLGLFPLWHDAVMQARGLVFYGAYAALPLIFAAFYLEDRRWLARAPSGPWTRTPSPVMSALSSRS